MPDPSDLGVLQVCPSLAAGGLEHVAAVLAWEFGALACFSGGPYASYLRRRGVSYRVREAAWISELRTAVRQWRPARAVSANPRIQPQFDELSRQPGAQQWLLRVVAEGRYRVVQLHGLACAAFASALRPCVHRLIYSHHNTLSERHAAADQEALREALRHIDQVTCPSDCCREDFARATGYPTERLHTVGNPSFLLGQPRSAPPERPCTFGTASNLQSAKGIDVLLEAWRGVPGRLLIAGGSRPVVRHWQAFAAERGLSGVEFRGELRGEASMRAFYDDIDVLVVPSRTEAFPLQVVEAMSRALPVIASALPTLAEVLGEVGSLFAPGDAPALRERLREAAASSVWRVDRGSGVLRRWQANYAPAQIMDALRGLYQKE